MPADAAPQPSDDAVPVGRAGVPAAPVVQPEEIWFGTPNVLMDGGRYTIGWQGWPEKKGGPSYVTVRRSAMGALKIVARFPLTDAGWTQAWLALVKLDSATAEAVLRVLAHRAEAASGFEERKKLDARSLAFLPEVIFVGGYLTGDGLVAGQVYELRFLEDRLSVFRRGSLTALAEFSYADVQAVEVAVPGRVQKWSAGQQAMLAAAFGFTGALVAYGSTRIKTFVRIQTASCSSCTRRCFQITFAFISPVGSGRSARPRPQPPAREITGASQVLHRWLMSCQDWPDYLTAAC